jgi:heme exporter protein A
VQSDFILHADELTKQYGRLTAVDRVSFGLGRGQLLALFGPNGAGKTTLLRLLAGLLRPTAGSATVGGDDARNTASVRGQVGLISHQTMLYPALTALENVEFAARLHGTADPRRAAMGALEQLGVADRASRPVRTLSRGLQQRVSIARAIVHLPEVLLLDEPYTGLDVTGAHALSELLHALRVRGATMVLVTHNIGEGLAVASHAAVMLGGALASFGSAADVDPVTFAREYRELALQRGIVAPAAVA